MNYNSLVSLQSEIISTLLPATPFFTPEPCGYLFMKETEYQP